MNTQDGCGYDFELNSKYDREDKNEEADKNSHPANNGGHENAGFDLFRASQNAWRYVMEVMIVSRLL